MEPSKVVHVGPSVSARGGISRMIAALLGSDLATSYQLEAVATVSGHRGPIRHAAFPVALVRLLWILLRHRPGAVHVHTASWGSFPRKRIIVGLVHAARVPVILQVHGGGFLDYVAQHPGRERAARRVLQKCSAAIVLSESLREPLEEMAPGCRVWVIPNAVEVPPAPTRGMDSGRVVFAGRPVAEKGVRELLDASGRLAAQLPGFTLVIAGDDVEGLLAERADDPALRGRVEMCGWLEREELDRVYGESAVFALPSYVEAMPVALLEAMSHGLACVATPVGTVPQIISDGSNGVIVPPRDAAALEGALRRLLDDNDLRMQLGARARETVQEHYSMASTVGRMREVYTACGVEPLPSTSKTAMPTA